MFSDPLSVTVAGSSKSLPRTGVSKNGSTYKTADGEFQIKVRNNPTGNGVVRRSIELLRRIPDPTPSDVFDPYRDIFTGFAIEYIFDPSRAEVDDLPDLRTALLALVNTGFETRLIGGEK